MRAGKSSRADTIEYYWKLGLIKRHSHLVVVCVLDTSALDSQKGYSRWRSLWLSIPYIIYIPIHTYQH